MAAHFLGSFRLMRAGEAVDTRNGGKSLRVLKYLLAHREQAVQKEVLIDVFWPDADVETVSRNLHQAIYTIRRLLRDGGPDLDYILFASDAYLVNPALSIWCDVEDLELSIARGRAAEAAGRIADAVRAYAHADRSYEGDYLADSPYEDWASIERERLRLSYCDTANRLADLHLDAGDVEAAAEVSRRLLRHEACDEEAHRRLIRCYGIAGHRNLVIHQYRAYVECSERMYGLGPSPEMTALYEEVIAD
jgi:DNA-binding SARP family transcriptional activator